MDLAFPDRRVGVEDDRYERRFRHVFVLRPPLEGATSRDFIEFAEDLKSD